MSSLSEIRDGFHQTLESLKSVLDKILIVGGWAPFVYSAYYWKIPQDETIPRTTDIDFGVWETGSLRYDPTVYSQLLAAGYSTEPYSSTETGQVEFICNAGDEKLKIEFITSFYVSEDTHQRFLGGQMACHRIEGFEIILQAKPLVLDIPWRGQILKVKCLPPSTYLFHKGLSFVARSGKEKRDKDQLYIYYILRHCPDVNQLLDEVMAYKKDKEFLLFKKNILKHYGTEVSPGYRALRPFLSRWMRPERVVGSITSVFSPLLERLRG